MDLELETFFLNTTQLEVFLISCIVGVVIGIIYDVFRIFRIVIPHNSILVFIEDIILSIMYGVFIVCFAFALMRGQIRFFFLIGNFIGFILWFFTIGSVISKTALRLKLYILKLFKALIFPIRKLIHFFRIIKKKLKIHKKILD